MLKTVTNIVSASQIIGVLPVANGGTGVTTSTGTGSTVLSAAPTLSDNVTLSTGNLVLGTSGKGIDFSVTPGTGTSELLNDYEEGTFSPTIIGTTEAGTVTYGARFGNYTKIGRLVTVEIYLNWSAGTGTGSLAFGGLPFTIGSNVYGSAPIWAEIGLTSLNYLATRFLSGGTTIDPFNSPVGGGATNPVAYQSGGAAMLTATYSV